MESTHSLTEILRRAADQSPSERVGVLGNVDLTCGELFRLVERAAARLVAIGLKPGDVVALSAPDIFLTDFEYEIMALAVIRTRAAVLPVYSWTTMGDVKSFLLHRPVKLIITINKDNTLCKVLATELDIPHLPVTFTRTDSEIIFTAASKSEVDTDSLSKLFNCPYDIAFFSYEFAFSSSTLKMTTQHDLYNSAQWRKSIFNLMDAESIIEALISDIPASCYSIPSADDGTLKGITFFDFCQLPYLISDIGASCYSILSADDGALKGNPFRQKMYPLDESSVVQGLNPNKEPLKCGNGVTKFKFFNGINSSVLSQRLGCGASMPEKLQSDELAAILHNKENAASVVRINGGMQGSGVIWNTKGLIVTNNHVIGNAKSVGVTLADKSTYTAEVFKVRADYDIALLRIINLPKEQQLTPVKIGVSAGLQVCQKVYAMGHPFGLGLSTTSGIISSLERPPWSSTDLIQFDAPINPGNSGGALFNSSGELIGINTFNQPRPDNIKASCGVGFAIPVDTVSYIVDQIVDETLEIIVDPCNPPVKCGGPALGIKVAPDQSEVKLGAIAIIVLPHRRAKRGRLDLDNIIKSVVSQIGAELGEEVATQVVYPDLLGKIPVLNHDSKKSKKRYLSSDTSHHYLGRRCEGFAFHNLAVGPITA